MANYKFKSTTVEAHQNNADTFENVYTWAQRNNVAFDKTEESFKVTYDNETFTVIKNNISWVVKCLDGRWLVMSERRFQQLFEAV